MALVTDRAIQGPSPAFAGDGFDAADEWLPRERRLPPRARRVATRVGIVLAVLVLAAAAGLIALRELYTDRVYPAVAVADVDVGGRDAAAARALLQERAAAVENGTLTLRYGDQIWTPSLREVGVTVEVERSLADAWGVGREATGRERVWSVAQLVSGDRRVPLMVAFDESVLNAWMDRVDAELGLPPHDAQLEIEGATATIVPEVDGTIVDRPRAADLVRAAALGQRPPDEALPTVTKIAAVRAGDLAEARATAERILAEPVRLRFEDESWNVDPADVGRFITQQIDPAAPSGPSVVIGLDEAAMADWLGGLVADGVNRDPVDAEVAWGGDEAGLVATSESADGYRVKPKSLAAAVAASLQGDHAPVEIPVKVIAPAVDSDDLGALGVTSRLAVGDSNYSGSNDGRATNVEVGTGLLNGTLIPPGEVFSFNRAIGEINEEKGYVEAGVVDGERIGKDIGGGICQVSTTVFRAALMAGVPIVEWWPHRYRLAFYEQDGWQPGIDASILQPEGDPFGGGDFRFKNPTDSWMLVESFVQDGRVYVVIYGPDLGYDVDLSEVRLGDPIKPPKQDIEMVDEELPPGTIQQSEHEQEGVETTFERSVTDRDGNPIIYDTWTTRFEARPDVWKVSPDKKGQSPASRNNAG